MLLHRNSSSRAEHAAIASPEDRISYDEWIASFTRAEVQLAEAAASSIRYPVKPASAVRHNQAEECRDRIAEIALAAENALRSAAMAHLLPLRPVSHGLDELCYLDHWLRGNDIPLGEDGAFLTDLAQLSDLSTAEAAQEVALQAKAYTACAESASGEVRKARAMLDEQFGFFQPLMKLNEIGIVTEDGTPWLLADFWMLDDELCMRRHHRMAPCAKSLAEQMRIAAELHDHRLAIWHLRSRTGASLFIDSCAATAMAWGGVTLPEMLERLQDEPWVALELRTGDVIAANATLYIEDCILTAHIIGTGYGWQLRGSDLIASDARSCTECLKNSGMRYVQAKGLNAITSPA